MFQIHSFFPPMSKNSVKMSFFILGGLPLPPDSPLAIIHLSWLISLTVTVFCCFLKMSWMAFVVFCRKILQMFCSICFIHFIWKFNLSPAFDVTVSRKRDYLVGLVLVFEFSAISRENVKIIIFHFLSDFSSSYSQLIAQFLSFQFISTLIKSTLKFWWKRTKLANENISLVFIDRITRLIMWNL